jgi:hypothetical protein
VEEVRELLCHKPGPAAVGHLSRIILRMLPGRAAVVVGRTIYAEGECNAFLKISRLKVQRLIIDYKEVTNLCLKESE